MAAIKSFYIPGGWPIHFYCPPFFFFLQQCKSNPFFRASHPLPLHTGPTASLSVSQVGCSSKVLILAPGSLRDLSLHLQFSRRSCPRGGCHQDSACFVPALLMATAVDCRPAVREAMVIDLPPQPVRPHWFERYVQPCVAELLGTTFLVFIGCLSDIYNTVGTGMLQPALANGLALGISIAALGAIR